MPAASATGMPALVALHAARLHHPGEDDPPVADGLDAVVIGRSKLVGKPLAQLLLAENATVTIAHSKSRDLPALCRRADLVFAAVGRA